MISAQAHQLTRHIAQALYAGDVDAMHEALRPGQTPPADLFEAMRQGFWLGGGDPTMDTRSFLDICHDSGRLDMFDAAVQAEDLWLAHFGPSRSVEAARLSLLLRLQSCLSKGHIAQSSPLQRAVKMPQPHGVELLARIVAFQEPDWCGHEKDAECAAVLVEAKMRVHIGARLNFVPSAPAAVVTPSALLPIQRRLARTL